MTENYKQDADRPAARIHPKKSDSLLLSALFLVCIVILIIGHWEHWEIPQDKIYSVAFGVFIYCIFLYSRLLQRASILKQERYIAKDCCMILAGGKRTDLN